MDYLNAKLYDMQNKVPDWLVRPPPINPYLVKHEYEVKFTFFT